MFNAIKRFVDHPAPFAVLGGMCLFLGLAQDDMSIMLLGSWGLIIALWNYEGKL